MRYLRIFLLHFQYVFAHPSKTFVWFLMALVAPMGNLVFWIAAIASNKYIGVTISFITSYYFLQVFLGTLLMSHQENEIGNQDIHEGQLTQYLLKPFSYFWLNFFEELPYRLIESVFSLALLLLFFAFFNQFLKITHDPMGIIGAIVISVLALSLSFTFKMGLGLTAFWTTDTHGLFGYSEILIFILAGYIMPLSFMPVWLKQISFTLPFSYMLYFPIIAVQGTLSSIDILKIIFIQCTWLVILTIIYKMLWKRGIRKFTAIGQ